MFLSFSKVKFYFCQNLFFCLFYQFYLICPNSKTLFIILVNKVYQWPQLYLTEIPNKSSLNNALD